MGIVFVLVAILFIVIGIMLKHFKCYWLISGYNTASAEAKKKVDIDSLGRFMGNCCFLIGAIFLVGVILSLAGLDSIAPVIIIPVIGVIIFMILGAQKYDGNNKNPDGSTKRSTKIIIGSIIAFIIVTFGLVFGSILTSINTEHIATIENGSIKVNGFFGTQEKLENFTSIVLKDEAPVVIAKTNGSGVADICRGSFKVQDIGTGRLYVHLNSKPFIYMLKKDGFIVLNFKETNKTQELYKKLMDSWKK